jgi:hypothetical protein
VLLLRCQHGLELYAIFIDLVKAFDTVQHDLLCKILNKYGLPDNLVKNVAKLYRNCTVKIKVGKSYADFDYTTGVHQGGKMSPVLFLFIIPAFLDTLKLEMKPASFSYFPENKNGNAGTAKGRLINQNVQTSSYNLPFM